MKLLGRTGILYYLLGIAVYFLAPLVAIGFVVIEFIKRKLGVK